MKIVKPAKGLRFPVFMVKLLAHASLRPEPGNVKIVKAVTI
jgi:hypothetical protein